MLLEHWEHGNGRGIILPSRSSPSMRGMHTHEITRRVAWARIGRVFVGGWDHQRGTQPARGGVGGRTGRDGRE